LPEEVQRVHQLSEAGFSLRAIERETGISRATVREWLRTDRHLRCPACGQPPHDFSTVPPRAYAYLLGIYLGDGTISKAAKQVWVLRVFQDTAYPGIIGEIVRAMSAVMPKNRVFVSRRGVTNCVEISSRSRAWPCYFPQVGPGRKHEREIELAAWQRAIVWQEPGMFLRGLIHSDGCRVMNRVWHGKYAYPRYFFSNHSLDIQRLFREAADIIGIEYANNRWHTISVARRASVALLDEIVGPKT
jgi:hypothetical protein